MGPLLAALAIASAVAASQPPAPTGAKTSAPQEEHAQQADNKASGAHGTADHGAVVINNVFKPAITQEAARNETKSGNEAATNDHVWEATGAIGALIAACATVALVWITRGLVFYTQKLWKSTDELVERTEKGYRLAERAYVKMSHTTPGLRYVAGHVENGVPTTIILVTFEITNFGRTPARVTRTYAKALIVEPHERPPKKPVYREGENEVSDGESFLVKDENFTTSMVSHFPPQFFSEVMAGKKRLYVFGYVDYIDIFEGHHRGGYARWFDPQRDIDAENSPKPGERNNLLFVDFRRYNYDRERDKTKEGESHDWDE